MSETVMRSTELTIVAGRRVGTICLRQPCALCGRPFDAQSGVRMVAAYEAGELVGAVCPDCASAEPEELRYRLARRAERLREKAELLERWAATDLRALTPEERAAHRDEADARGRGVL
jgi:ribosome-binding protein aMBF1 (putative translation factor)